MKSIIVLMCLGLSGCSLVQWMPTSACEYVKYERVENYVEVEAQCTV